MEQLSAFMQIVVERGIIYAVGVIVIWRGVKLLLGKKNGTAQPAQEARLNDVSDKLYKTLATDKMKGYARSAITGQVQICTETFEEIKRRLGAGDAQMRDMSKQQSKSHGEVMRAIGRLEGAVKAANGAP